MIDKLLLYIKELLYSKDHKKDQRRKNSITEISMSIDRKSTKA